MRTTALLAVAAGSLALGATGCDGSVTRDCAARLTAEPVVLDDLTAYLAGSERDVGLRAVATVDGEPAADLVVHFEADGRDDIAVETTDDDGVVFAEVAGIVDRGWGDDLVRATEYRAYIDPLLCGDPADVTAALDVGMYVTTADVVAQVVYEGTNRLGTTVDAADCGAAERQRVPSGGSLTCTYVTGGVTATVPVYVDADGRLSVAFPQ